MSAEVGLEAIAEENRREIIERLLKGRQERVRKGLFPGGNIPYGYQRKNKIIAINPCEAEIVKEIYALADNNKTGQEIADILNSWGYTRRNDRPWTQRQVSRILYREKLYHEGLLHYGEIYGKNEALVIL